MKMGQSELQRAAEGGQAAAVQQALGLAVLRRLAGSGRPAGRPRRVLCPAAALRGQLGQLRHQLQGILLLQGPR